MQKCNLPTDNICLENATILERFNRYPLIIDPAGQATEFIKNYYASKKLNKSKISNPNPSINSSYNSQTKYNSFSNINLKNINANNFYNTSAISLKYNLQSFQPVPTP